MKKTLFFAFLIIFQCSSCKKDRLSDTRDNNVATYSVSETWTENNITQSNPVFTILVTTSSLDNNRILLSNFANYGMGVTIYATISGSTIVIPRQILPNNRAIQGDGSQTSQTMTYTYTETFNNTSVTIKAVAQKL